YFAASTHTVQISVVRWCGLIISHLGAHSRKLRALRPHGADALKKNGRRSIQRVRNPARKIRTPCVLGIAFPCTETHCPRVQRYELGVVGGLGPIITKRRFASGGRAGRIEPSLIGLPWA